MIKLGIIPKVPEVTWTCKSFLAKFQQRRQLANTKGTQQAQHLHAITSCEVEVSLFPTHGMHSKHLWCEGMLQKSQ